jgi:hypothetical protein
VKNNVGEIMASLCLEGCKSGNIENCDVLLRGFECPHGFKESPFITMRNDGTCTICKSKPLNYDGFCRAYSSLEEYEKLNYGSMMCEKFESMYGEIVCGKCRYFNNHGDYNCDAADTGCLDLDDPVKADDHLLNCGFYKPKKLAVKG